MINGPIKSLEELKQEEAEKTTLLEQEKQKVLNHYPDRYSRRDSEINSEGDS